MTATPPVAPPTEQIYGIAKKINLELERLPLHTHAGIVNMLRTMVDHRNVELQNQMQLEQIKANEAAMADARAKHAEAQVKRDAAIASEIKAPRLVIEDIGKAKQYNEDAAVIAGKKQAAEVIAAAEPEYEQVTGG